MSGILTALALVAGGSALGGMTRYWLSGRIGHWIGETFPWGTLAVNASGALVIGFAAALVAEGYFGTARTEVWLFAVTGFLGSYTTVSSFSLQTLALLREGKPLRAIVNVALSVFLCLGAAAAGFMLFGVFA